MRLHTERLPDVFVAATGLDRPLVEVTVRKLKEAGMVTAGSRYAEPLRPIDIARILLGLAAMSATSAAAHCRATGATTLAEGEAVEETAEAALVALVEAAVGLRGRSYDLHSGEIIVGQSTPYLQVLSRRPDRSTFVATYGSAPGAKCVAFTRFPINSIVRIARDLLKEA